MEKTPAAGPTAEPVTTPGPPVADTSAAAGRGEQTQLVSAPGSAGDVAGLQSRQGSEGGSTTEPGGFNGADTTVDSAVVLEMAEALRTVSHQAVAGQTGVVTAEAAARFAASVEELSRTVEHLQVVAASHLEQVRTEAEVDGTGDTWTSPDGKQQAEYRNTADYLRDVIRVNRPEAACRLKLANQVLPSTGLAGQSVPPAYEHLAAAIADGKLSAQAAATTATALGKAKTTGTGPETLEAMEESLTTVATEQDPGFVAITATRWLNHIDQDGPEPTEAELRHRQGVFLRGTKSGLRRLEILATDDQYEHLITTMNAAANPRARGCHPDTNTTNGRSGNDGGKGNGGSVGSGTGTGNSTGGRNNAGDAGGAETSGGTNTTAAAAHQPPGANGQNPVPAAAKDERSMAQKRLDGLVTACDSALATGGMPATGGHRPQIMAIIDYQELLGQLTNGNEPGNTGTSSSTGGAGGTAGGTGSGGTGSYMFGGPVHATNIRQLACDAEIIPTVLAGNGKILNLGTGQRLFPPHLRRALVARDGGCAFPGCTMPAAWTEAHHITYASDSGETSTDNGCLACSFHHHLIHKEKWTITVRDGIPWFAPPPYVDPDQKPLRNHYFDRKPHQRRYQQTTIEFADTG